MNYIKKIFRERATSFLFITGLVVSCFILINIGDLLGKINNENRSYNSYKYNIEVDIYYPGQLSSETEENKDEVNINNRNDIILKALDNITKGNIYISTYVNINNSVEVAVAELIYKTNEDIVLDCEAECDFTIENGVITGSGIVDYTYELDGQMVIDFNGNIMSVIGILKDNTVAADDIRIYIIGENCEEEIKKSLIEQESFEIDSVRLCSNSDINNQYTQLKNELQSYGFNVSVSEARFNESDMNYFYKFYNSVFLAGALIFSLFTCFVVADLWIYGRRKELTLRRTYGYSMTKLATLVLGDVFKLSLIACVIAVFIQVIYELSIGDNPFRGQLLVEVIVVISGMVLLVILISLCLIEKIRKNTIIKGLQKNENN